MLMVLTTAMGILLLAGLQRQLRGARFARIEREFCARWSRLPEAAKHRAVAHAYGLKVLAGLSARQLDGMMFRAVDERWRAMCATGRFDFASLGEDLSTLVPHPGQYQ